MDDTGDKIDVKDEKTIERLFKMFFPRLCIYASSIVKNDHVAADIVQDVFIKLWNKKLVYENLLHFKVYIYRAVKNACLNSIRDAVPKDEQKNANEMPVDERDAENRIIESEIAAIILNAVNELPEARRKVILLKLKGLKLTEIAEVLDISINTVKSYQSIAFKELKPKLKDLFFFVI